MRCLLKVVGRAPLSGLSHNNHYLIILKKIRGKKFMRPMQYF